MNKQVFTTIDEYIDKAPVEVQGKLKELRSFIKNLAPEAEETIAYQMPTFKLNGKGLAYFAAFKNHIGFYPFPSGVAAFKEETAQYVTSKGTIQLPLDKPLPLELIEKIIKFRIKENLEKKKSYG
ncbi:MAG: DUF1801 domain-containing protein [Candidatus Dojkabacteria bacterium]